MTDEEISYEAISTVELMLAFLEGATGRKINPAELPDSTKQRLSFFVEGAIRNTIRNVRAEST